MKIIGGHDYYDGALAHGRDDDLVFVRDCRVHSGREVPLGWHHGSVFAKNNYWRWGDIDSHTVDGEIRYIRGITVYVGNRCYYGVEVKGLNDSGFHTVFWKYERLEKYAIEHNLRIAVPEHWNGRWVKSPSVASRFEGREISSKEHAWMTENRVAIAVGYGDDVKNHAWHCNDAKDFALKNFMFQKRVGPYELFQEISMFVGNWPNPGNPTVKITDDKVKAEKHGFDKWSFRRHKDDPR